MKIHPHIFSTYASSAFSTNVTCVCASAQFVVDATACLTEHCTTADLAAAVGLQNSQCTSGEILLIIPNGTLLNVSHLKLASPSQVLLEPQTAFRSPPRAGLRCVDALEEGLVGPQRRGAVDQRVALAS